MLAAIVLIILAVILFGGGLIGTGLHFLFWVAIIVVLVALVLGYRGRGGGRTL